MCLTIGVDASENMSGYNRSHDHHDRHNEVGHEGNEHEDQVCSGTPATLYDLQKGVCLQRIT